MEQIINSLIEMILISLRGTYGPRREILKDCYIRLEKLLIKDNLELEELSSTLEALVLQIKELDK